MASRAVERVPQEHFEQFVEFAPDAIVAVDADRRIVLVNAQTEAIFGYRREELIGRRIELLVPARFRAAHPAHVQRYFAAPRARPMGQGPSFFGRRKGGGEFPAEISLSAIHTEHGVLGIAAVRDITKRVQEQAERDRLRAELERTRRAEEAERQRALEAQLNQLRRLESVGQLAGGIAHDFNNMLAVILNCAQFVADAMPADAPARADVEEIRRTAERAAALTRQLLIFSRGDVAHPQVLNLNDMLSELVDTLLRRALGEHVTLETRLEPELWSVNADPRQLEQVVVNLALNARDAMPSGGRLAFETANVELDETATETDERMPAGRYVRLVVSDTGSGMTPEVLARAFEPFFTTKPRGHGTGLGLPTVYGIVTEAGGTVHLHCDPGRGTRATVYLPATSATPVTTKARRRQHPPVHGETILVVEDEASVRELVQRILTRAGYHVLAAEGGPAALALCEQAEQALDLVLTDVVMPKMPGPELAARIRAIRPGLRMLYMSGYPHEVVSDFQTSGTGRLDFIAKPFTAKALLTRVREALDEQPMHAGDTSGRLAHDR